MRQKRIALILVMIACLLLTNSVMAMSSTNFEIGWMVPLSGGGGRASSTHYATHLTIGQTAIGLADSANFQVGWGFWSGIRKALWELLLPVILK